MRHNEYMYVCVRMSLLMFYTFENCISHKLTSIRNGRSKHYLLYLDEMDPSLYNLPCFSVLKFIIYEYTSMEYSTPFKIKGCCGQPLRDDNHFYAIRLQE